MDDAFPPRRTVFVNRFYWPDETATAQLLTDLAAGLAAAGESVAVVTSGATSGDPLLPEIRAGVEIHRVCPAPPRHGVGAKALDFLRFSRAALCRLRRLLHPGDTLVLLTDPPLLAIPATRLARRRGVRVNHWLQDIYPEVALALAANPLIRAGLRAFRPWRNLAWRHSDGFVTLGVDMAALTTAAGVPRESIRIIPNWAPAGLTSPPAEAVATLRKNWGLTGKWVVAYAGNLGRVHDLDPILDIAAHSRGHPDLVFAFIGGGPRRAALEKAAVARGLSQVRFFPAQPRANLAATLALGDVHVIALRASCATAVFPSKLYGIAAAARPVVFIGPPECEIARLIRRQGMGLVCPPDAPEAVAAALTQLAAAPEQRRAFGEAAARFHRESGGFPAALQAWREVLSSRAGAPANLLAGFELPRP